MFVSSDAFVNLHMSVRLNLKDGPMIRPRQYISIIALLLTAGRAPAHLDVIISTRILALLSIVLPSASCDDMLAG